MTTKTTFVGCLLALCALSSQAFQITSLSPQGEVAQVRQIVAKFDDSAVSFGDPKAEAPLTLRCSDAQVSKGTGRWISERAWGYEFERDLPPGVSCTLQVTPGLKSAKGVALSGPSSYRFNTGGPFVQSEWPFESSRIDEEQYFVLRLSGKASLASVQAHVWCAMDGLGERIAVRLLTGPERAALLKSRHWEREAAASPLSFVTLACQRRLTPSAKVQLVFGRGVATSSGVANSVENASTTRCASPLNPASAANAKMPRAPACRYARSRCPSMRRWPESCSKAYA